VADINELRDRIAQAQAVIKSCWRVTKTPCPVCDNQRTLIVNWQRQIDATSIPANFPLDKVIGSRPPGDILADAIRKYVEGRPMKMASPMWPLVSALALYDVVKKA
jgi:hypothetical protein